ncbi:hypothetical protein MMC31_005478 [Peltigera leucophlebia]|nr:hypothetical protein [Peltigera leucophlebia]
MVVWFPPNNQDQGYQEITDPDTLQQLSSTTELHICLDRNATSENALARQLLTMMGASLHTIRLQSAPSLPSIFSQTNFGLTHLLLEDVPISSLRLAKFPALTHLSLAYCPGHVMALQRYAKPTLQHLCLLDCRPAGSSFNKLATFLMKFNGLKSLAVCYNRHQRGTVAYLKQRVLVCTGRLWNSSTLTSVPRPFLSSLTLQGYA